MNSDNAVPIAGWRPDIPIVLNIQWDGIVV